MDLPLEVFRKHLRELSASGRVVSLKSALTRLRSGAGDDRHRLVLTFDDAFANFREVILPLLVEYGLPATLYVPTGFIDGDRPSPLGGAEDHRPMTWRQLADAAATGLVELGSHSVTHPDLRGLDAEGLRFELEESRRRIETETGCRCEGFCYPRALWSESVRRATSRVYSYAVAAGGRRNRSNGWHPFSLSRHPVRCDMPADLAYLTRGELLVEEWLADRMRRRR